MECANEIGESLTEVLLVEWYSHLESYLMERKANNGYSIEVGKWIRAQNDQKDFMEWYKLEALHRFGFDWELTLSQSHCSKMRRHYDKSTNSH